MLKPIKINYLGKKYNILGFASGIAIEKSKGYGKILMTQRIDYVKKRDKTALGFTTTKNLGFFRKCGLKIERNLIRRFIYKNPLTDKEIKDNIGEGIYLEGRDGFMKKSLKRNQKFI